MNVNGVTSTQAAYTSYNNTTAQQTVAENTSAKTADTTVENGVIYEPSTETKATKKYTPDTNLVEKLKADAEQRAASFRSMIEQMMSKQTNAFGQANDIWKFLASGKFEVDPATKLQAQKDIAEDGYWGVKQTSDRIIDFATALTGGDPDKIEEMREAFKKGYKQAEETWGGELPEISKQTYEAVMKKFDELAGIDTSESTDVVEEAVEA
ncbi:MAG: hypothetical protein IJX63_00285 [Lachnospiraceae bacterium]|nr:hypothetical protein [Lachnospiraceae bacterium]